MRRTMSRRASLTALASAGAATGAAAQAQTAPPAQEKIVYHLNQPGGEEFRYYRQFIRNLSNHVSVMPRSGFDLRVVMHGEGLGLLRRAARADPQIQAAIDELKLAGLRFEICRITLQLGNIRLDELYDAQEDDLVPSGVAQLAHLQQQGFAYIKI